MLKEIKSDEKGLYKFDLVANKKYYVRSEKDGYETKEESIVNSKYCRKINIEYASSKQLKQVG